MKRRRYTFAVAAVALTGLLAVTALAATTATINGTSGNDVLKGTPKSDVLSGKAGNDKLYGYAGNDTLIGGPGNDLLVGGPGADVLKCGPGKDTAIADAKDKVGKDCEVVKGLRKPPPPPPIPAATPGHYVGTTGDNELWVFDIGADGLSLTGLQTGQINESCDPPDITLFGGNLNAPGPIPVALDGSFTINATINGTVGGNPSTDTIAITGHVSGGSASGTIREDTSFTDSGSGTAYSCTSGNQTWTASKT